MKSLNRQHMAGKLPVSVTVILPTRNEEEALAPTVDSIPRDWCDELEIMIVDGNSTDRTREIALEKGIRVHLEPRKGYGRAYRSGFVAARGDIIVTMDADCTYPAEVVPELVKKLLDEDLDFITCDRLTLAEEGSMSGLHGFGNWMLSINARLAFGYGIKDSQSGMWVFRKSIFDNEKMRPTNDGMPLSEEDRKDDKYIKGVQCVHCRDIFNDQDRLRFSERQKYFDSLNETSSQPSSL